MNAILKVIGDYISNLNFVFDLYRVGFVWLGEDGLDHYFWP
jgi:hypothetical protein